ncbi:hypothetical protein ACFQY7_17820 [Actinomadura luteofluorescens]|uniref:hypothetical protein n=1 Tax=Actinomadura luteofluorescens TaxID=46163 RepID=UPI00362C22AD
MTESQYFYGQRDDFERAAYLGGIVERAAAWHGRGTRRAGRASPAGRPRIDRGGAADQSPGRHHPARRVPGRGPLRYPQPK